MDLRVDGDGWKSPGGEENAEHCPLGSGSNFPGRWSSRSLSAGLRATIFGQWSSSKGLWVTGLREPEGFGFQRLLPRRFRGVRSVLRGTLLGSRVQCA